MCHILNKQNSDIKEFTKCYNNVILKMYQNWEKSGDDTIWMPLKCYQGY